MINTADPKRVSQQSPDRSPCVVVPATFRLMRALRVSFSAIGSRSIAIFDRSVTRPTNHLSQSCNEDDSRGMSSVPRRTTPLVDEGRRSRAFARHFSGSSGSSGSGSNRSPVPRRPALHRPLRRARNGFVCVWATAWHSRRGGGAVPPSRADSRRKAPRTRHSCRKPCARRCR